MLGGAFIPKSDREDRIIALTDSFKLRISEKDDIDLKKIIEDIENSCFIHSKGNEYKYALSIGRIIDFINKGDLTILLTNEKLRKTCASIERHQLDITIHKKYYDLKSKRESVSLQKSSVINSFHKCSRCSSTNVDVVPVQKRSADEGMTNKITCYNCGLKK
jgi:DNA-directed RNA polymerase subunit M/transcription elongation factor TFIIS